MWILFVCLIAGAFVGWFRLLPRVILNQAGRGMMIGVLILLLTMGLRIGVDQNTLSQLGSFGLQAFLFAVAAIIGSVVAVWLLERVFIGKSPMLPQQDKMEVNSTEAAHPYQMTCAIIGAFIAGIFGGILLFPQAWTAYLPTITTLALDFTLVMVGIDLGLNRDIWRHMLKVGWQVFLAPVGVVLGSIVAAMVVGLCFGWELREGGAVGAGFGWYSLSGVLISDLHSVSLGTIAFLSNIFREVLAIIFVPFLAKRVGPLALVAPSGATAMDSTLPLLVAVGPKGIGIVAIISGFSLSLLVPVLVPLVLG
ncbi:MAG TPA: lysine exporter LysO family protein [Desulfitobacterium dehalogenans]|uniref:Lysine exporter LysO family protein n=1 Tax=Desulfitobacterium dehalogenans TaxID=36854 RepID=A0A7C7D7T8_9FIRM|nr:lysine exporter LysO family protein [Desulfitobacterium dehalogenans]